MTFNSHDDSDIPFCVRRLHRRSGRRVGAPTGNSNRMVHGLRSKSFLDRRKAFAALMRACREAAKRV